MVKVIIVIVTGLIVYVLAKFEYQENVVNKNDYIPTFSGWFIKILILEGVIIFAYEWVKALLAS